MMKLIYDKPFEPNKELFVGRDDIERVIYEEAKKAYYDFKKIVTVKVEQEEEYVIEALLAARAVYPAEQTKELLKWYTPFGLITFERSGR